MAGDLQIRFVLVRPANALNIGAVGRAMANFGLNDLAVVSPVEHRWREARSAIYGSQILDRASVKTLDEALADCRVVLGTASAHNRVVKSAVTLPAVRPWLKRRLPKGGRVAILLGNERNGLSNDDLSRCHAVLRIPTREKAPSMNLGQAAAVTAYELVRPGLEKLATSAEPVELNARVLELLVESGMAAMDKVKVNGHMSEASRRQKLRAGFLRWRMTPQDAAWLRGLFVRLSK